MIYTFEIDGKVYHDNKKAFKGIRGGITFLGFQEMAWGNDKEHVSLEAERDVDDEGKDYTKKVTLIWKGRTETKLLVDMVALFEPLAEEIRVEGKPKTVEDEIKAYDGYTKSAANNMKREGATPNWIRLFIKERISNKQLIFR